MVDYSKWNNLDSDDSGSESEKGATVQRKQQHRPRPQAAGKAAADKRLLDQAEVLRLQGNSAYEQGYVAKAIAAYDAQLRVLEGLKDEAAAEMICGALLNQASGFIRLKKFGEAEARCSRLLACTAASGGGGSGDTNVMGGATARARALHFRGFARLQQGVFEGACADLRSSLAAGSSSVDEARALLLEAEAGAAMSSCQDPEAKGRDLLRQGQGREAAQHFRDAATRARRRKQSLAIVGGDEDSTTTATLARNLRMQGVAIAVAGDRSSAELLLRAALKESRAGGGGKSSSNGLGGAAVEVGGGRGMREEEGLALAALGSLLAQGGGNLAKAVEVLREAVAVLDKEIAGASAAAVSNTTASSSSPPSEAKDAVLTRTLTGTLVFLGTSLVSLEAKARAGDGPATVAAGNGTDAAAGNASCGDKAPISTAAVAAASESVEEDGEAVAVLKRAHGILNNERAAIGAAGPSQEGGSSVVDLAGGESRGMGEVRKQTAKVLDALSEAYAGRRRWGHARSAAEQSLTAWRSLGDAGKAGAAASLLSLGHLSLQLHGIGAGIEEASARWEEAAACFNDYATRPSDAAEVRLKIAGFYSKVVHSDPSRLEFLEQKMATHYAEAAGLFARERHEKSSALKRSAGAVAAAGAKRNTVVNPSGTTELSAPLPPSLVDSLEPNGQSRWELAQREAFAWEGYAGAANDHEAAITALRKAEGLLNLATVSEKDEGWTLRKVGLLNSLALALARVGEHALAEDKLLEAIRELKELDGVNPDVDGCAHKEILANIFKYLALQRRARDNMPGVEEALAMVEKLGGSEGRREVVEGLGRLMGEHRISVD